MKCNNCGKELKEGAKFCGYCGAKTEILKENTTENKQDNKKIIKISLKKSIFIVLIVLLLILIISVGIILKKKKTNTSIQTHDEKYENNIEDEKIEKTEKVIPEEKQVNVTFMDSRGNEEVELREIVRQDLIQYMQNIYTKTKQKGVSVNWFVYESKIVLYYIEYDYRINGLDTTHTSTYGAIMYSNHFYPSEYTGSILFYKTHIGIWSTANQVFNEYTTIYETGKLNSKPIDIANIRDNRLAEDLKNSIQTLNNTEYSNIRIGVINKSENPWLQEYFNNQKNEEQQENIYEEQNIETKNEVENNSTYKETDDYWDYEEESSSNDTFNYEEESSIYDDNSNSNNEVKEYSSPEINIYNRIPESTKLERIGILCFVRDDYSNGEENIHFIIKNNGNTVIDTYVMSKNMTNDNTYIPLSEGTNNIEITATNSKGKTSTERFTVIREAEQIIEGDE